MRLALSLVIGLALVLGASAAGVVLWRTDEGRSSVGVARRTDGSVTLVTAWCAGERLDEPRIDAWVDGRSGHRLMAASGSSTQDVTAYVVGRPNAGMEETVNEPLPESDPLVAYNAGQPDSWWPRQGYPSSATVFRVNQLPVSDTDIPREVMVGDGEIIPSSELFTQRCTPHGEQLAAN